MREPDDGEGDAEQQDIVIGLGDAFDARGVIGHRVAQPGNRRTVRAQPFVDALVRARAIEQEHHPDLGDDDVDRQQRGKAFERVAIDFEHGGLVGAAADPASRQRRQPAPCGGVARTDDRRFELRHDPQRQRPAEDDAHRGGQEHDDRLVAKAEDPLDIDRQRHQEQRGGQEIILRHRPQIAFGYVDQAEGRHQAGDEIADQDDRHEDVEALPAGPVARGEYKAEHQGKQPENNPVVADHVMRQPLFWRCSV